MELKSQYTFDGTAARVWDLLTDPAVITACLPGCESCDPLGPDRYRVVLTAGVASIVARYEGTVAIVDKRPPESYRLVVEGGGRPGFVKGESLIHLTEADGRVIVDVDGHVTVGGLVAQVGQRLIGATARMTMDRFFRCLGEKVALG